MSQALTTVLAQSQGIMEEIQSQGEMLNTSCEAYLILYERAREAFMSFVNFAPSVQSQMTEVEKWHHQFELKR